MIYTVTFNPSLDYVVQADQLIPGDINRTTSEHIYSRQDLPEMYWKRCWKSSDVRQILSR